jgi:hypothetical protein
LHPGFVAQPVNAWSSLAFLVAGLWIFWGAVRQPEARRELSTFGLLVMANAAGSFAYHGPAPTWGHWVHDMPAVGIPLFVAAHDLGLVRGWSVARRLLAFIAGLACTGVLLALAPGASTAVASVLVVAAAAGEVAAFRAGFRPRPSDGWSAWLAAWIAVIAMLLAACVAFVLGRTASGLCDPESVVQYHALWHALGGVAAAAYAFAALEHGLSRRPRPPQSGPNDPEPSRPPPAPR